MRLKNNMIRIIGGLYKHRLINQPPLEITRCTKDIAKEGLFNSLGGIGDKSFLDLFSGSGAIGIEAFSRGAKPVYLNEINREAKRTIMRNLMGLGISEIEVLNLEALKCIDELSKKEITFDIIFLDPPYKFKIGNNYLINMLDKNIATTKTWFIIESDYLLDENEFLEFNIKVLKYGRTYMNILKRKENI